MGQEFNVLALVKGQEHYIFVYDDDSCQPLVDAFRDRGVVFVDDVSEVPPGAPMMLSAHGSAPEVVRAARRGIRRHDDRR